MKPEEKRLVCYAAILLVAFMFVVEHALDQLQVSHHRPIMHRCP